MDDKKIFRDPIYNLISFNKTDEKVLLDLIDCKEFQRLKRIRQLGLSYLTYPSAVHDRFSHSLGVSYLIGLMFECMNIPEEIIFNDEFGQHTLKSGDIKLLLKIAGLLHDIGHGPFSHAFEKITKVNHELVTLSLIKDDNFSIKRILNSIENERLQPHIVDWVTAIIDKSFPIYWVKELLSSQLDADRMDYLIRDAYMCGVKYSTFDWKWILTFMRIKKHENDHELLAIDAAKGLYSIESFIISRYHMYEQVYFHKTTRGFEVLIKKIFQRVKYLIDNQQDDKVGFIENNLKNFFNNNNDLESFLVLDDYYIITHINLWAQKSTDEILNKLAKCFINRIPFKLFKESIGDSYYDDNDISILNRIFQNQNVEREYYLIVDNYIQNPYKDDYLLGKNAPDDSIWLITKDNSLNELSTVSAVIRQLKNNITKLNRVYILREKLQIFSSKE